MSERYWFRQWIGGWTPITWEGWALRDDDYHDGRHSHSSLGRSPPMAGPTLPSSDLYDCVCRNALTMVVSRSKTEGEV